MSAEKLFCRDCGGDVKAGACVLCGRRDIEADTAWVSVPRLTMKMMIANAIWHHDRGEETQARVSMVRAQDILTAASPAPKGRDPEAEEVVPDEDTQFEVWQDDMMVASADTVSDMQHYLAVYGQDGPVEAVVAVTRRVPFGAWPHALFASPSTTEKENQDG